MKSSPSYNFWNHLHNERARKRAREKRTQRLSNRVVYALKLLRYAACFHSQIIWLNTKRELFRNITATNATKKKYIIFHLRHRGFHILSTACLYPTWRQGGRSQTRWATPRGRSQPAEIEDVIACRRIIIDHRHDFTLRWELRNLEVSEAVVYLSRKNNLPFLSLQIGLINVRLFLWRLKKNWVKSPGGVLF